MSKFLEILGEGSKMVVLRKNDEKQEKKTLETCSILLKELNMIGCPNTAQHVLLFYIYFYKFKYIHFYSYNFVKNSVIKIDKTSEQKFDVTLQYNWMKQLMYGKDRIFDDNFFAYNSFLILEPYFAKVLEKTVNAYYEKKKKKNQNPTCDMITDGQYKNELSNTITTENRRKGYISCFLKKISICIQIYLFQLAQVFLFKLKFFIRLPKFALRKSGILTKQIHLTEQNHNIESKNEETKKGGYMFQQIYKADNVTFYNGSGKNKYEYGYLEENLFFIPSCIPKEKTGACVQIEKGNINSSVLKNNNINRKNWKHMEAEKKDLLRNDTRSSQSTNPSQSQSQTKGSHKECTRDPDYYISVEVKFKCGLRDFQSMPDRYNVQQFIKKKKKGYWNMCLYSPSDFFTLHFWNIFKNVNYIFLNKSNNINVYINDKKEKRASRHFWKCGNAFSFNRCRHMCTKNSKDFYVQYLNEQMGNTAKQKTTVSNTFVLKSADTCREELSKGKMKDSAKTNTDFMDQRKINDTLKIQTQSSVDCGKLYKSCDLYMLWNNKMYFHFLENKVLPYNYYTWNYLFYMYFNCLSAQSKMNDHKISNLQRIPQGRTTSNENVLERHRSSFLTKNIHCFGLNAKTHQTQTNNANVNHTNINTIKRIKQKIKSKKKVYKLIKKNMYTISPKWNSYGQEEKEADEKKKKEQEQEEALTESTRYNSVSSSHSSSFCFMDMLDLFSSQSRRGIITEERNTQVKNFPKKKGKSPKSCRNFYYVYKKIKKKFKKKKTKKPKSGLYLKKNVFKKMKHKVKKSFLYKINKRIYYLCDRRFNKKYEKTNILKETLVRTCKTVKAVHSCLHNIYIENVQKAIRFSVKGVFSLCTFVTQNLFSKRNVVVPLQFSMKHGQTKSTSFCGKKNAPVGEIKENDVVEHTEEMKSSIKKKKMFFFENFFVEKNKTQQENIILLLSLIVKKEKWLFYKMLYFQCFNAGQVQLAYCMVQLVQIFEKLFHLKNSEEIFNELNYYKQSVREIFEFRKCKIWKKNKYLRNIIDVTKIKKISDKVFKKSSNSKTNGKKRKNINYDAFTYLQNCHFVMGNEIVIEAIHLLNKIHENIKDPDEMEFKRKTRNLYININRNIFSKKKYSFNYNTRKINKKKLYYSILSKEPISSFQHFFNLIDMQLTKRWTCYHDRKNKTDSINYEMQKKKINKRVLSVYNRMILFVCRFLISKTFCDHSTIFNIYKTDSTKLEKHTLLRLKKRRFKLLMTGSSKKKRLLKTEKYGNKKHISKCEQSKKETESNFCNQFDRSNNSEFGEDRKETNIRLVAPSKNKTFMNKTEKCRRKHIYMKKASYFNTRKISPLHLRKKKMLLLNTFNKNIEKKLTNEYICEKNKSIFYRISLIDISVKSLKRLEFWKTQTEEIINTYNTIFH